MQKLISSHLEYILNHLYISPLEKCNLRCKICYTRKTNSVLTGKQITDFITRYSSKYPVKSITFCGGEVFSLPYFTGLVNYLSGRNIFIQIITNGTIDRLSDISDPNSVNIIVSIDGDENYHDLNRGKGNFQKSIIFLKKAVALGFHAEIFSVITKQNINKIDTFVRTFEKITGVKKIPVTFHPRKPLSYLKNHPVSNIAGDTKGFNHLTNTQIRQLMKTGKTFPPPHLGCYMVSLMSNGKVYGCCEGTHPIGNIGSDINKLVVNLKRQLEQWSNKYYSSGSLGCAYPEFICGLDMAMSIRHL